MGMLVDESDELSGIVEDLLIAARSDIAKVAIHYVDVDLGEMATQTLEMSGVEATLRGVPGHANADPQRVRQILRNLLTNAGRYGGSQIRIDFAEGVGWTEISVADNGDGVPAEKRETIFQSYESAHTHLRRRLGWAGPLHIAQPRPRHGRRSRVCVRRQLEPFQAQAAIQRGHKNAALRRQGE